MKADYGLVCTVGEDLDDRSKVICHGHCEVEEIIIDALEIEDVFVRVESVVLLKSRVSRQGQDQSFWPPSMHPIREGVNCSIRVHGQTMLFLEIMGTQPDS